MQGQRWPGDTAVQRGACTCCYAVECTLLTAVRLQPIRAAPAGAGGADTAAPSLTRRKKRSDVRNGPHAAAADPLLLSVSRPPARTRPTWQGRQQRIILHGANRVYENESDTATRASHRTFSGSRMLAVLRLPVLLLLYSKLLLLPFLSGPSVTVSLARQLQLYSQPALPVFPVLPRLSELGTAATAGSAVLSTSPVKSAVQVVAEVLPTTRSSSPPCSSPPHPFVRPIESPLNAAASPACSRYVPTRRPLASAAAAGCARSSCAAVTAGSCSSASAGIPGAVWVSHSRACANPAAVAVACGSPCIAHVCPLSLRIISHTRRLFHSDPGPAAANHTPFSTAPAPSSSSALRSAAPAPSTDASFDGRQRCKEPWRTLSRVQLRCAPAASLSLSSSFPYLRWTRMPPLHVQMEDEKTDIETSSGYESLRLVKQQLQQQVKQHQAEIRSLLRGLLQMALQCLRSMWGVYFLGLSVLVLPFCASARPYLEVLNRVPLNDPYFLSGRCRLLTPASGAASAAAMYVLSAASEIAKGNWIKGSKGNRVAAPAPPVASASVRRTCRVKVPPLLSTASFQFDSRTSLMGRCGASARSSSSSVTPDGVTSQTAAAARTSAQPPKPAVPGALEDSKDKSAFFPGGEKGASGCEDDQQGSPATNGDAPDFSSSSSATAGGILRGWLVPAEQEDSRKGIICTHGWLANRQACLPFLGIARKAGLHKDHHIFLFDLKSSGESSPVSARPLNRGWLADQPQASWNKCSHMASRNGEDQLGCQAAEDLLQAILYLRETCGITTVSLYAQGVSAMGAMVLLGEYRGQLEQEWGITIDKVIFDSPVCSARDALQTQPLASCLAKTATWLREALIWAVTKQRGRQLHRLRASRLLRTDKPYKLLIFSSREDNLAPWPSVRHEMLQLPEQNRPDFIYVFPTGSHCDLARTHHHLYADVIQKFYKNPTFVQLIWEKLTGVHAPVAGCDVEIFTPRDLTAAAAAEGERQLQTPQQRLSAVAASLLQSLSCVRPQEHSSEKEGWT